MILISARSDRTIRIQLRPSDESIKKRASELNKQIAEIELAKYLPDHDNAADEL